jgi:exosortase/archaeosortase family protein
MSQAVDPRAAFTGFVRAVSARAQTPIGYLVLTVTLMLGFYSVLYQPYDPLSWPGTWLLAYLEVSARSSAALLTLFGESVSLSGTQVLGRFPFVVVLDCAALDAQALFAAAVLAFPVQAWKRVAGLLGGLVLIFGINTLRLVALYFAGVRSLDLFHTLHEEVFVFVIIACVCLLFFGWARWARGAAAISEVGAARAA